MTYSAAWDETKPAGTEARSLGDDRIREFKVQVRERMESLGVTSWSADPVAFSPGKVGVKYVGTTAQINALTGITEGSIAWDLTLGCPKHYTSGAWTIPTGTVVYDSGLLSLKRYDGSGWLVEDGELVGTIKMTALRYAPNSYLLCDGSAKSRTTYANLFDAIVPLAGNPTISIATPCVITLINHGLQIGDSFYLTTTGALPTGLAINTLYYVITAGFTVNSFQLSATRSGAAINTSGSQSGVHSLYFCPFGLGDGTTTFNVPNITNRFPIGRATATALGLIGGSIPAAHVHSGVAHIHSIGQTTIQYAGIDNSLAVDTAANTGSGGTGDTGAAGAGDWPPYITLNFIIKY